MSAKAHNRRGLAFAGKQPKRMLPTYAEMRRGFATATEKHNERARRKQQLRELYGHDVKELTEEEEWV